MNDQHRDRKGSKPELRAFGYACPRFAIARVLIHCRHLGVFEAGGQLHSDLPVPLVQKQDLAAFGSDKALRRRILSPATPCRRNQLVARMEVIFDQT